MFANPFWSVILLLAPIALYWFVIRPRLNAKMTELYADAGYGGRVARFLARIKARLYAFRTFWIVTAGAVITALPDLLVIIAPVDFSPWLPQPWPAYTGPITTGIIAIMRAYETTSGTTPPSARG